METQICTNGSKEILKKKSKNALSQKVFVKGIEIIRFGLPEVKLAKESIDIIYTVFSDLTDEQFMRGVRALCLTQEIYPSTNVIRAIRILALDHGNKLSAEDAWIHFKKGTKIPDNEVYTKTYSMIDHRAFGQSQTKDEATWRIQFVKSYKEFQSKENFQELMGDF